MTNLNIYLFIKLFIYKIRSVKIDLIIFYENIRLNIFDM